MRTNGNITIWNKYIDPATPRELYQRTQIKDIAWENRKASNTLFNGGRIAVDQATIYIPIARGKLYVQPATFRALVNKVGHWTIQEGDIIAFGLIDDDITVAVTDPVTHVVTPAFTVTDLRAKYDDVLIVTSIDSMLSGSVSMRHWKVGAH